MATTKYKRGTDGYFQAKVWDGTYRDGKKHRVSIRTKKSSRELERLVSSFERDVEARSRIQSTNMTFLQYARSWLAVYKSGREGNTKAMYENIIEKHLIGLEYIPLQNIDRIHLQQIINNSEGHQRTQQQIRMTFKQILESAVADHLFPSNVMEDIFRNVETIKYTPKEKRPLTENERICLFKADLSLMDKSFVYLLYGCGLRRGEAIALTVFDFNLQKHTVTINKAHETIKSSVKQKNPKSQNGFRTVPIPNSVFPVIEQHINRTKSENKIYLFTKRDGKPMTKSSYDKMWKRIQNAIQAVSEEPISGLTAHIFRHNYCTMLCYQIPSISIKRIAKLLGDTEKMVLEVYNHIVLEKENAEDAINKAMNL